AAPVTADDLIELARQSGLIDTGELKSYLSTRPPLPGEARSAAERLVSDGELTRFQVKLLLAGRSEGFRLGSYRALDRIGVGGMGEVFLCDHVTMRRRVAIKTLPPEHARDRTARERFLREARTAASMDHPNIVRAHDAEVIGDVAYLVMEYIDGVN